MKAVAFFRAERDWILKEGPPKVGQIIGGTPTRAAQMYYYERPEIPATNTIGRHLDEFEKLAIEAETLFTLRVGDVEEPEPQKRKFRSMKLSGLPSEIARRCPT
jgi:hypothetical protein